MKINDTIKIVNSLELSQMGLVGLANRIADIVELKYSGDSDSGCWVRLQGESFMGEQEWFVPSTSIEIM